MKIDRAVHNGFANEKSDAIHMGKIRVSNERNRTIFCELENRLNVIFDGKL